MVKSATSCVGLTKTDREMGHTLSASPIVSMAC